MRRDTDAVPSLVDTHCHLDDASFDADLVDVLEESREAGVLAWIMVGFAPGRWSAAVRHAATTPGIAHMLGVHPSHAQEWNEDVKRRLIDNLQGSGARAVGEIGFDFLRDNAAYDIQRQALVDQLEIARRLSLPAVFHMRAAEDQLLRVLEQEDSLPKMVFHSFDGSPRLTRFVLEHDAVIGVGGLATRKKSETLREQLREIPLESMVLESDSPYLVPAGERQRRNTPAQVGTVARFLSAHLDIPLSEVARHTTLTAESVFGSLLP